MTLARAQMSVERFEDATRHYETALRLEPGHASASAEVWDARRAAAAMGERERAMAAAAADVVAAARQNTASEGARLAAEASRKHARGDALRSNGRVDQRRGLWGGELEERERDGDEPAAQAPRLNSS